MPRAIMLVNAETGIESSVLEELRKMENVKEVHMTYGAYDIIAELETKTMEEMKECVTGVRYIPKVRSTITMMVLG